MKPIRILKILSRQKEDGEVSEQSQMGKMWW
jgi:hypothetical protein